MEVAGMRLSNGFDLVINLVEAAKAGMGVAMVQECMVRDDLQTGKLVAPIDIRVSTGRGYYLCWRRAQVAHPASDLFIQWLQESVQMDVLSETEACREIALDPMSGALRPSGNKG